MSEFEHMVEMAREAEAPEAVRRRMEATLANLPARDTAAARTRAPQARPRTVRPRWRRAGVAAAGIAACAAVALCLPGAPLGRDAATPPAAGNAPAAVGDAMLGNAFSVRQAYGDEATTGGSALIMSDQGYGTMGETGCFTSMAFKVEGRNIAHVSASVSQGQLCRVTRTELDADALQAVLDEPEEAFGRDGLARTIVTDDDEKGSGFEIRCETVGPRIDEDYDPDAAYGFCQPGSELPRFDGDDPKADFWKLVDSFDGAVLDVAVTYTDGTTEAKSFDLRSGKLKVAYGAQGAEVEVLQEIAGDDDPFVYGLIATLRLA